MSGLSQEIKLQAHSGIYTLKATQFIPQSMDKCWDFFATPINLEKITPNQIRIEITSPETPRLFPGQLITYKIGVLPWPKRSWVTEITHVKENAYFIDQQLIGPYSLWHHIHRFTEVEGGVVMTDEVSFKLPLGMVGRFLAKNYVKRKVTEIFEYRAQEIGKFFRTQNGQDT
jgi:ligand-binding SRPBCC domain-containing protein